MGRAAAVMVVEPDGWAFLSFPADVPYRVLDGAEAALRGREDYAALKAEAEPAEGENRRLPGFTVEITPEGRFDGLQAPDVA